MLKVQPCLMVKSRDQPQIWVTQVQRYLKCGQGTSILYWQGTIWASRYLLKGR